MQIHQSMINPIIGSNKCIQFPYLFVLITSYFVAYSNCQSACAAGSGLSNGAGSTCLACATHCIQCTNDYQICTACASGYGVSSGNCIACTDMNCIQCSISASTCNACKAGYAVSAGTCAHCTDSHCISCTPGLSDCKACSGGYGLTSTKTCSPCGSNCRVCSLDASICTACASGYGILFGACVSCFISSFCHSCSQYATSCTRCNNGYGVLSTGCSCPNSLCSECRVGVASCSPCQPGYGLYAGNCIPCSSPQCIQCSLSSSVCTACSTGYGLSSGNCVACSDPSCLVCTFGSTSCMACSSGSGVSGSSCSSCTDTNCIDCPTDINVCVGCTDGFGISSGSCIPCTVTNCSLCSTNAGACTKCDQGFGFSGNTCRICDDINCLSCPVSYTTCVSCNVTYGLYSGSCVLCLVSHCQICSVDANVCTSCSIGYGLLAGTCATCTDQLCIQCPTSVTDCDLCLDGYGVNSTQDCDVCLDTNCTLCSTDYSICKRCITGFGVSIGPPVTCQPCFIDCLTCSQLNYTICTSCRDGYYLSAMGNCQLCISNCDICPNAVSCSICSIGYYLSNDSLCYGCPNLCSQCQYNSNYSGPQCTVCIAGKYQLDHSLPTQCWQMCGDSETTTHPCDNQLSVPWDGCDDYCQISPNFDCEVTSTQLTVCSYTGIFQTRFISFSRSNIQNTFILQIYIYPPLNMFKIADSSQLLQIFHIASLDITTTKVEYDYITNHLKFTADFTKDITEKKFTIEVSQSIGYSVYLLTTIEIIAQFGEQKIFYYSELTLKMNEIGTIFAYVITVLGWVSLLIGFILRKIAGLEAMVVLQMSWLPLLWLASTLHPPYRSVYPLHYTSGYNHLFFNQTQTKSDKQHYTFQFKMSQKLFANNFNLSFIFQILALFAVIITYVRLRYFYSYSKNYQFKQQIKRTITQQSSQLKLQRVITQFDQVNKTKKTLTKKQLRQKRRQQINQQKNRRNQHYQYSLQSLMYACIFNLTNYTNSALLFLHEGFIMHLESLILLIFGLLMYLFVFWKFYDDPYSFDIFRSSTFRDQTLPLCFYFIFPLIIISTIILLALIPQKSWISIIPIFLLFLYVIIQKPYFYVKQNYRAAFNLLVICSCLCVGTVSQYFQNELASYLLFYINIGLLLPLVIIISVISSFYFYYYENYIKKQEQANLKLFLQQTKAHIQSKVLRQLVLIDVRQDIQMFNKQSIFKKIVSPRNNLIKKSKQIKEQLKMQNKLNKNRELTQQIVVQQKQQNKICLQNSKYLDSNQFPIHRVRTIDSHQEKIEKNIYNPIQSKKQIQNIKKSFKNSPENFFKSCQISKTCMQNVRQDLKINERNIIQQKIQKYKNSSLNKAKKKKRKLNASDQQDSQSSDLQLPPQEIAKKVLANQINFIKYRAAEDFVNDQMDRSQQIDEQACINAYQDIQAAI